MEPLQRAINDLVIGNRILAHHGVFDEYGHVSMRHPRDPARFLMARDRVAAYVEPGDILEFTLDGNVAGNDDRPPHLERFVHAAIYAARPDVKSVVCASAEDLQPFGISGTRLDAVLATVGNMGSGIPVWDIADKFGDATELSISTPERARDLAQKLGSHLIVLTRGVGFVATGRTLNDAVRTSFYIPKNARVLAQSLQFGTVHPISPGETKARLAIDPEGYALRRGWEYWAKECGCERLL